ncbi:MAG: hypothetical protein PVJ39_04885 [Gammaproteobacteria bacterium]|jgi:hypothetical protein
MLKVYNKKTLADERFNEKFSAPVMQLYDGTIKDLKSGFANVADKPLLNQDTVEMATRDYVSGGGRDKLYAHMARLRNTALKEMGVEPGGTVKNAAQAPSYSTLSSLVSLLFVDMTRRYMESPDYTTRIVTETNNPAFRETVTMRDILKYRGQFEEISGSGDSVPLIEQALAETDTFDLTIRGIGWATSLKNILFNEFHTMQKVVDAVNEAYVDQRNAQVIGAIVGATFDASQQVAAGTSGDTYEENIYITFRNAIQKLRTLKDNQTDRPISVPSITMLCNSADSWYIQRAINGQLATAGGDAFRGRNNTPLPINEVIEYDRGANDGFTWGKKTMSFSGVTQGTCYLFVPREYAWVATKRGLTMESSTGSALTLSQEERAWYFVQGEYLKDFLGSSYSGASSSGYGAIVEITLPDADT